MKSIQRQAFNALRKIGAPVFTRTDDESKTFHISAEEMGKDSRMWADYYGSAFGACYPTHDPRIDAILEPLGLFAEWDDPASLSVWEC